MNFQVLRANRHPLQIIKYGTSRDIWQNHPVQNRTRLYWRVPQTLLPREGQGLPMRIRIPNTSTRTYPHRLHPLRQTPHPPPEDFPRCLPPHHTWYRRRYQSPDDIPTTERRLHNAQSPCPRIQNTNIRRRTRRPPSQTRRTTSKTIPLFLIHDLLFRTRPTI